ncbi:P-loop containing nucleoside triphosphate hydrolase protein [Heliocybe sulcata]|uniref:P-loop containing nucleoside triphosphate hydrolase protein n=1 Tax=Heliocybe sulcata TaxID=5364 RepID=A0A5C3NG86_9AGAM|nr:P-loop containing nucleoside triphosphate hydrolase protein [Heliocybe sulcata]
MAGLFFRQLAVLFWKNWIVMSKHPLLNILRCFLLPIGYGVFLAVAQTFLIKPNNYGIGSPVPVRSLGDAFDGSMALIWADSTNGTSRSPTPEDIIARITRGFSSYQLNAVKRVDTPDDIPAQCPQNFNLYSECFAAIAFNGWPTSGNGTLPMDYTIRADAGLAHIDAVNHLSDYELRLLPLQFAVDQAIIELTTGTIVPTPQEWVFTQETNAQQNTNERLSYIRGLRTLLVLALFIDYVGIAYQLPGSFMGERANLLTSHLKAMGLMDSARIISWHTSISLAYLPAWIVVSLVWHYQIFSATNAGLVLIVHLLFGWSLASWSFFVSAPFGNSPQLAAVASTFLSILFAILALVFGRAGTGAAFIFSVIFPPGYYIFAIRAICGFENHQLATNVLKGDPDNHLMLLPLIIAAIIDIFLWPWMAVLLERRLYDAREPSRGWSRFFRRSHSSGDEASTTVPPNTAISIRNLSKTFNRSLFGSEKGTVTAVGDLTLDIPKYGIYVLLGSNGAGKSTTLSIVGGLLGRTSGSVTFEGGVRRPPRGTIGIVPQKNVLFPELTCYQTLRVWNAIKRPDRIADDDDIDQLLRDCDLGKKIHSNANTLSGGQKRKLQLAIGLIGGSRIVLVDECTSGVDPLSRRALWKTLMSVRHERTIVFTTHFLDEADLLADNIAVLAPPGKKVAEGTPVALKSTLGEGYTAEVTLLPESHTEKSTVGAAAELLQRIRNVSPDTYISTSSPTQVSYHLKSKDPAVVEQVLDLLSAEGPCYQVASYDVHGASIEDIFLDLLSRDAQHEDETRPNSENIEKLATETSIADSLEHSRLSLTDGRKRSPYGQAFTIVHKRALIARRSWLSLALTIIIAVAGSCVPLFFLSGRTNPAQTCGTRFHNATTIPIYLPTSPIALSAAGKPGGEVLISPPNVTSVLGASALRLPTENLSDNTTFVRTIQQNYLNLSLGGISMDLETGDSLIAWEGTPPGLTGLAMLNLATNVLYKHAVGSSPSAANGSSLITANYESFPAVAAGTLVALKWVAFFGAAMSVFPAFFSLYVSRERRSSVQAMQLSNGLADPIGLWLGHLIFDSAVSTLIASIIIIIFAAVSNQFNGLGFFWVVLVLYGIVAALFAYCISLMTASPLAAFAAAAGYQIVMFVLYLAAYLLTVTYAKTSQAGQIITTIHFTLSVLSPVASVLRACFVSVNLFSLLCNGNRPVTASSMGDIMRYGGPILYLFVYGFMLFGILVWVDSGSTVRRLIPALRARKPRARTPQQISQRGSPSQSGEDIVAETKTVETSDDALRVLHVVKAFGQTTDPVVNDVSFGVSSDTVLALLGPNGAGKTTTFNMIRGDIIPDSGDILITGTSVIQHPRTARLSLGVCPQFTAIDPQLSVAEHLAIYGRLKGLYRGKELKQNVDMLMKATGLDIYKDRLASKLSGGNQRKLALAIALMGNPAVILIDEFSTGIDAKMKREMWGTLRNVAAGKAVVITTHSMEEASALANKVGILAKRMLAVGTTTELVSRFASYEVHFSTRSREEVSKAQELMARLVPGSRMKEDVATRFEVPIKTTIEGSPQAEEDGSEEQLTLARLFHLLSSQGDFEEYTVERASLESVFLRVIRENEVREEEGERTRGAWWKAILRV